MRHHVQHRPQSKSDKYVATALYRPNKTSDLWEEREVIFSALSNKEAKEFYDLLVTASRQTGVEYLWQGFGNYYQPFAH